MTPIADITTISTATAIARAIGLSIHQPII